MGIAGNCRPWPFWGQALFYLVVLAVACLAFSRMIQNACNLHDTLNSRPTRPVAFP